MFATLKNKTNDANSELTYVGRPAQSEYERRNTPHLACKSCQLKKVKCSGQPGGCNRCQAKRMTCMYAKSARRSKRSKPRVVCPTRSPPGSPAQNPDSSLPTLSQPEENWESLVVSELSPREDACDNAIADTETGLQCVSIDIALNQVLFDTTPDLDGTHSFAELQGDPCGSGTQGLSIAGLTSDFPSPNNFQELLDSFPNSVSANSRMNILPSLATDQRHVNNAGTTFSCGDQSMPMQVNISPNELTKPFTSPLGFHECPTMFAELLEDGDETSPSKKSKIQSPMSASCLCMSTALSILETLERANSGVDNWVFDRLLVLKKTTITRCNNILSCNSCVSTSTFVMLLTVICEKLTNSFEEWAIKYDESRPGAQSIRTAGYGFGTAQQENVERFFLGMYEVDSTEEQCSLLRSLALVQLRNLRDLLNRLKCVASCSDWKAHESLLSTLDRRTQEAAAKLLTREIFRLD